VIVGVPKETKRDEYRVAMLPVGVEELVRAGHTVLVERGAGSGSGLPDESYAGCGAELVDAAAAVFGRADMIVKVKEPQRPELALIRPGQTVFTYFHFAADRGLTEGFLSTGATAVAYETLRDDRGRLPLLVPMSEVAGRMSIQEGAKYLERPQMGRGILLGGVPGVAPANVLVLGAGSVGANAAKVAAGFGANIALLDTNLERLRYLDDVTPPNIDCLYSDRHTIRERLGWADLVVGSILIPGARAPHLVERGHQPADHPRRSHLRRGRRGPLLRHEHAGRGGPHQHLRVVQRHPALRAPTGRDRCRSRRRGERRDPLRRQRPPWSARAARRGGGLRAAVREASRVTHR
jgi:alanine dehydrogenase